MRIWPFILIFTSSILYAQKSEEDAVKKAVNQLFNGMKTSDSILIKKSFHKNAVLQTITKTSEVKSESIKDFVLSISKAEKGSLDERITFSNILIDENLASVWTLYEFYYKGQFSHCGVNSFQLVKSNNEWKIQYIIDTRRKDNCKK
ncbi:nuclear transport factor 2 family protein [Epilithonimonas vandammei]|uniref:Nuclear transport factor 2 family protein n=1 Tax=Epilithonimonas vandammei TaxID=2487072 RepID=A0A3G8Y343_9FLAO|nr:nuclear transport factor 2 family protein [Epilithonimonas vandammei]AZI39795.1 hypothetical protein EIB74_07400 [Epilithonimonas vandammei]